MGRIDWRIENVSQVGRGKLDCCLDPAFFQQFLGSLVTVCGELSLELGQLLGNKIGLISFSPIHSAVTSLGLSATSLTLMQRCQQ